MYISAGAYLTRLVEVILDTNGKYKNMKAIIPVARPKEIPLRLLDGWSTFVLEVTIPKIIPTAMP